MDRARTQSGTSRTLRLGLALACSLLSSGLAAEPASVEAVLRGLAPVGVLLDTQPGRDALAGNLRVTGGIQSGEQAPPGLVPFAEQQQIALRDAFITQMNGTQLADGFGSRLGAAYQSLARYEDRSRYTAAAPSVTALIAYTNRTTAGDSNAAKFFFANLTSDSQAPVPEDLARILTGIGGTTDIFGKAYGLPAGDPGANKFGNSRPFQTLKTVTPVTGMDYFGKPSNSRDWLEGPASDLRNNPSFPSGHTTYGYMESVLLGILVPERYQQQVVRAAEYGNSRIVLGAHYAMDVMGGRTLALYDLAHLLANDPAYLGRTYESVPPITDYRASVRTAQADLKAVLEKACGGTIAVCAAEDRSRFSDPARNQAFVKATLGYGLPAVYPEKAAAAPEFGKVAPEAGYLLTVAFPSVTLQEANAILTETLGPPGGFLDDGSAFGLYSRIDLYEAVGRATALARQR